MDRVVRKARTWKLSSRLMRVKLKIERESSALTSPYGPGSKKSEEDMEGFSNELNDCVWSFGRNECV